MPFQKLPAAALAGAEAGILGLGVPEVRAVAVLPVTAQLDV